MGIISILSVVDCESIINNNKIKTGGLSKPAYLGESQISDAYVYMLATENFIANNVSKPRLTVRASVGDNVHWTITGIDRGLEYNVILQRIVMRHDVTKAITGPVSLNTEFSEWIGAPQPSDVAKIAYHGFILDATVLNTKAGNQIQYIVSFYITDTKGAVLGYYYWEPFINIIN